jgi:hypothetical protein
MGWTVGVPFLKFSLFHSVQPGTENSLSLLPHGYGGPFVRVKSAVALSRPFIYA